MYVSLYIISLDTSNYEYLLLSIHKKKKNMRGVYLGSYQNLSSIICLNLGYLVYKCQRIEGVSGCSPVSMDMYHYVYIYGYSI